MTERDLPPVPELTLETIEILLENMQPTDVQRFKQHCMIFFPDWLFRSVKHEAELEDISYEDFVREACLNEIRRRFEKRVQARQARKHERSKKEDSK